MAGRLARLIAGGGPIPLAHYMALCNAHYYATRDPLGAAGDFTTAPEISQMFGELIGLWCADLWQRAGAPAVAWVELGPGRGTLAADARRAMGKAGLAPPVHLVETSPVLAAQQATRVAGAVQHDSIATLPTDRPLIVIANEFFDALPIRQLVRTEDGWAERMVDVSNLPLPVGERSETAGHAPGMTYGMPGAFHTGSLVRGSPAQPGVPPLLSATLTPTLSLKGEGALPAIPVGATLESSPASVAILRDLAARIVAQGGALLAIDYGYEGPRAGDSFQALRGHAFADPFADPGVQDLTAHVDFAALATAARDEGAVAYPVTPQGALLTALGIAARAAALARAAPARTAEIEAAWRRLVDGQAMGTLFKALAVTAPGWPTPAAFGDTP